MSNYNQTTIAGQAWLRCHRIVIENPYTGVPAATFMEERLIELPSETLQRSAGLLVEPFTVDTQDEAFDLRHPVTGEVVGTATYAQLHVMLHSLYYHLAAKRDAAQA